MNVATNATALTQKERDQLTALWAEGHSTAEIGRRMGRTKNSIVGHAHRMGLRRPSPIKRHTGNIVPRSRAIRAPKVTLAIAPTTPVAPVRFDPSRRCCWPMWGNERPTHRYCDGAVSQGRSYCDTHRAIAYTREVEPIVRLPGTFGFGAAA